MNYSSNNYCCHHITKKICTTPEIIKCSAREEKIAQTETGCFLNAPAAYYERAFSETIKNSYQMK